MYRDLRLFNLGLRCSSLAFRCECSSYLGHGYEDHALWYKDLVYLGLRYEDLALWYKDLIYSGLRYEDLAFRYEDLF